MAGRTALNAGNACPLLKMPPDRSPFVKPDVGVEILPQGQSADYRIIPHSKDGIFYSHAAFAARQLRKFLSRHGG